MKIALLGAAGFVGRTAARELSARPEIRELLLVDYNIREAKRFAKSLSPKCLYAMADVGKPAELARLLEGVTGVANAVGPCTEYEKGILLTCAERKVPVASIGDGTLSGPDAREIHDAFLRAGVAAVSGCGMMPGWTELLSACFLTGNGRAGAETPGAARGRYLFCSLDRFGGYAFFRRVAKDAGEPGPAPPGSPAGSYFRMGEDLFGLPPGRPANLYRMLRRGLGPLGAVGMELSAAFLFWLRGFLAAAEGTPAAVAGAWSPGETAGAAAAVSDPEGRLTGALLAETVLRLASGVLKGKGLLPIPEAIGREEAERLAASCGGKIRVMGPSGG
ncbi:MAG: saccharopine dehydrogenase NADP-binding domain-containing protein [Deltaproteobacteria bacterium]|nr:saccharopine dehydrogenase NADP-binding domain-containing protein [Deltaproteobacteria bacterium]